MTDAPPSDSELVLVLTPTGRDGALTRDLLERDGYTALLCGGIDGLCAAIAEGAGLALIAEEVLTGPAVVQLTALLREQPPWSDFPIIVFSALGSGPKRHFKDMLTSLGNVSFLDRPVHVRTMLAAVHAALRGRRRQYAVRHAIASRDQFLAMLGHELRNPLGAIQLASELTCHAEGEAERERHRLVIDRQTRHLSRLVDDLLDVARVTYGKIALACEPVDACEVVRTCFDSLAQNARAQGIGYRLTGASPPAIVRGDRVRLEQIFINLITNAIKYTPAGGSVGVEIQQHRSDLVVSVVDSGIGISPDALPRVFDLFMQVDNSLARSQGGMGLGLTLVRNLVRLHGGTVTALSNGLSRGSEFRVTLPLVSGVEVIPSRGACGPESGKSLKVVIVEDNEDIRVLEEELLSLAGHEVQHASDGPSGVAMILRAAPDVALVDIGLPGFDGFEVARRVRASSKRRVRLIAVSGYGQSDDRARALQAGFDDHLTKPVAFEALSASMNET